MMVPVKYKYMHQTSKVEEFEKAETCIAPELHIIFCREIDKNERGENKCCSLDGLSMVASEGKSENVVWLWVLLPQNVKLVEGD